MRWAVLILTVMLVTLAGSFGISLLVVEWRGTDGDGQIGVNRAADWVACQVKILNQLWEETGEPTTLNADFVGRVREDCGVTSDIWVLCVHTGLTDLPEEEYAAFGTSQALSIAKQCEEQIR